MAQGPEHQKKPGFVAANTDNKPRLLHPREGMRADKTYQAAFLLRRRARATAARPRPIMA